MRILVDETVIADYVGERQPYCACWSRLNALELVGYAELWTTPEAYRVLEQMLSEALPALEVRRALSATLDYIKVCSFGGTDVAHALSCSCAFGLGVLDACARKIKPDYVVSHAVTSLPSADVRVLSPDELFDCLERERGVTFELVDF